MNETEMKLKNLLGAINKEIVKNKDSQDLHKGELDKIEQTKDLVTFSWKWLGVSLIVGDYLSTIKKIVEENGVKNAENYLRFVIYQIKGCEADAEQENLIYEAQQEVFGLFTKFLIILS